MTIRRVVSLGHPVLSTSALLIDGVDDSVRTLARDLIDTMRASPACVGLAAPQIGVGLRAFVLDVTGHPKARSCRGEFVLFNPVIAEASDPEPGREGCMSVPDLTGTVNRARRVVVRGMSTDGADMTVHCDAFEARAVLHEIDHLDGMVFLDRVVSADAVFRRKVYR